MIASKVLIILSMICAFVFYFTLISRVSLKETLLSNEGKQKILLLSTVGLGVTFLVYAIILKLFW